MTAQSSMAPGPSGAQKPRNTLLIIGAAALAVLVACVLIVRFTAGGGGSVDSPSGLSATAKGGAVKLAWTGVDGADSYQVVRDSTTVAYDGGDTTFTDMSAPAGRHSYVVRAVSGGVVSAASAPREVTVGSSWGAYAPFVAQLPDLLPQSPEATGWEDLSCAWELRAFSDESGPADEGSGEVLSRARISCRNTQFTLSVAWLTSKDATDSVFRTASTKPGSKAIKWRFGTGYLDERNHVVHLRPDTHENLWIGLGVYDGTRDDVLDVANRMPLE